MQRPTDSKRIAILDLASRGYPPAQIAGEVAVSRQYVHAVLTRVTAAFHRNRPERLHDIRSSYQGALANLDARGRHHPKASRRRVAGRRALQTTT